ncbi:unnamed protein product [Heligmosomoides polygyrus]|uniref:Peptidase A2 domain-containing protein n=1 Tax=Heligmosomoides polygyrus TaxID=6339 RepID=A0A3P8CHE2_HELPZ|nr:unnamed protein product [Heligmosomoides polygyrus]
MEGQKSPEHTGVNVLLLTGLAKVKDSVHNQWKDVEILLDTGADQSFISNKLADELGLPRTGTKRFKVYTFGAQAPKHTVCNLTTLELWDKDGLRHEMRLHTLPLITAATKTAQLSKDDLAFIESRNIRLSKAHDTHVSAPQILLGCDQLWGLLSIPDPHYTLPSGLHLVPSKLGYLLTGKQIANKWKGNTIMETREGEKSVSPVSVNSFINFEASFEEELDRWDKYWTMDSAGVCEFTGTKNAERDEANKKVAKFFEETIQKRGTVHHHLRCAVSDIDLANEIRENLYVDNLILSGDSSSEVVRKSLDARKIFSEMGMNLREFTSNDPFLRSRLPEEACASLTPKKVLGVVWDAEIQTLNNEEVSVIFGYIHTSKNPADAGTRGLSAVELETHEWWRGPDFLTTPVETWPIEVYPLEYPDVKTTKESICEESVKVNTTNSPDTMVQNLLDLERYSTFLKAKRIAAVVLRFIRALLQHQKETVKRRIISNIPELKSISESPGALSGSELRAARLAVLRNHQFAHLTKEYRKSMKNTLRLYQDSDKIWRSKGRMGNASMDHDTKDPIFVAPKTTLAQLLIREAHDEYHKGVEHTIATVRENYWIPKLRQQVRSFISQCVKCRRFNALPYHYPDTTDLPSKRVTRCYPFQHIGLDFFDFPPCACLNSRPLTYRGSMQEELSSVRPIDFLQKDINLTFPSITTEEDEESRCYVPPEDNHQMQYRQLVVDALHSSCQRTDHFWSIWKQQYLTSLREAHKRSTINRRLGNNIPMVGDVVLINDPVLPRNE